MNTNHDPHTGQFTFGANASHAEKATFHREQEAKHLKRAAAAKKAWIKIRANRAAKADEARVEANRVANRAKASADAKVEAAKAAEAKKAEYTSKGWDRKSAVAAKNAVALKPSVKAELDKAKAADADARHLKAVAGAKKAWIKIRANKEAAKVAAGAKAELDRKLMAVTGTGPSADAKRAAAFNAYGEALKAHPGAREAADKAVAKAAARGAGAPKLASEGKADEQGSMGLGNKRELSAAEHETPVEQGLRNAKIVADKALGQGGVNHGKRIVTLDNGAKAVVKPNGGEPSNMAGRYDIEPGYMAQREAGAWEVGKRVGMQNLVTPTVIREYKGQTASFQLFNKGAQIAMNFGASERYDGKEDLAKAALFDYVIGNTDRHAGNWMLNQDSKGTQMHLIDHGLSFPESHRIPSGNKRIMEHAGDVFGLKPPKSYAAPYLQNEASILKSLTRIGLLPEAVDGVKYRIEHVPANWDRLQ